MTKGVKRRTNKELRLCSILLFVFFPKKLHVFSFCLIHSILSVCFVVKKRFSYHPNVNISLVLQFKDSQQAVPGSKLSSHMMALVNLSVVQILFFLATKEANFFL